MEKHAAWLWLSLLFASSACSGENLSVGDLRCVGAVECVPAAPLQSTAPSLPVPEVLPERDAELVWSVELSCPKDRCSAMETAMLLHEDGTITIAQAREAYDDDRPDDAESILQGVWIGRFDADGTLIAEDDSLIQLKESIDVNEVELALTEDDRALLGSMRVTGDESVLTVYEVGKDADPERLFRVSDLVEVSAIASVDDEVLITGTYWDGSNAHAPIPELARYDRRGNLVFRQTALRRSNADLSPSKVGLVLALDMPAVTLDDGRTYVAALDSGALSFTTFVIVEVGADGNPRWSSFEFAASPLTQPKLTVSSRGDLLVGQGDYQLVQYAPPSEGSLVLSQQVVQRSRSEYWDTSLLGFDYDADDRMLVVTQEGPLEEPRLLLDRYARDFSERETFVVQGAAVLLPPEDAGPARPGFGHVLGLEIGSDGELYVFTASHISRIELR